MRALRRRRLCEEVGDVPEVTYCIEAVIEKYPDGRILCPLLETGGSCEECVEILERRADRED